MIKRKTTFILGAGASIPYGFPSGESLSAHILEHISSLLNNFKSRSTSPVLMQAILTRNFNEDFIIKFRNAFTLSGQPSIDAFLEHRTEFIDLGKILIAYDILLQERINNPFSPTIDENWYQYLWRQMCNGVPKENFQRNDLRIITFNYDRTFEHYFQTALQNNYKLNDDEAYSLMISSIGIVHVHGLLGQIFDKHWLNVIPYGVEDITVSHLAIGAKNIKIISETDLSPEYSKAKDFLNDSEVIYITGFGYHPTNVHRLGLSTLLEKGRQLIIMNTHGLTESELHRVFGDQTRHVWSKHKDGTNLQFLKEIPLL